MTELDHDETELLDAYERGELTSVATKEELARIREAARATQIIPAPKLMTGRGGDGLRLDTCVLLGFLNPGEAP